MMMNLYDITRAKAHDWAVSWCSDISPGLDAIDTLNSRVTWRGWNLVEGPPSDRRHDDPGTKFDDFDVAVLPEERRPRIRAVKALNNAISGFCEMLKNDRILLGEVTVDHTQAKFGERYARVIEGIRVAMSNIRQYQDESFIPFDPQLWVYQVRGREWRFETRRP
jgi:hypothetical protein